MTNTRSAQLIEASHGLFKGAGNERQEVAMHAHPDPRRMIATALSALALTLPALMLTTGRGGLALNLASSGHESTPAVWAPSEPLRLAPPTWLKDPLASPLEQLRAAPSTR
jgi:hypothetical protein